MSFTTDELNHATQLDLKVAGNSLLRMTDGVLTRPTGTDKSWFVDLLGDAFGLGGGGAVAQAQITVGSRKYNAWEFPNGGTDPILEMNFWLPPDYNGDALKCTFYCFKTATATGSNIVSNLQLACVGAADDLDATLSSGVTVTDAVGANDALFLVEHTITPANAADGGLVHGIFQRLPTNVADDYTDSVYLIGARVEYA